MRVFRTSEKCITRSSTTPSAFATFAGGAFLCRLKYKRTIGIQPVLFPDLPAVLQLHDFTQPGPRLAHAAERRAVPAPAPVPRIAHDASAHRIQIDVCGDDRQRLATFDQHTLEAFLPQRAAASRTPVEPSAEALLEPFHVKAEIPHAAAHAGAQRLHLRVGAVLAPLLEFPAQRAQILRTIDALRPAEQCGIPGQLGRAVRPGGAARPAARESDCSARNR